MDELGFHGDNIFFSPPKHLYSFSSTEICILLTMNKSIGLDFWNDKIEQLDSLKVWEKVIWYYNPKAREWKDWKVYNSINGRRIHPVQVSDKNLDVDDSPFDL